MDRSKDAVTKIGSNLPGIMLETKMTAGNIESFFSDMVSGKYFSKKKVLFFLKQNDMMIGILQQLTSKMKCMNLDRGLCLANMEMASLMKTFRESRELLIVSVSDKLVLVTKSEMVALLRIKIEQEQDTGSLIKRQLDRDTFVALLLVNTFNEEEGDDCSSSAMSIADEKLQDNDSLNEVNITNFTPMIKDASKLSPSYPSIPKTLVDWEENERNQYERPECQDKYPTQVTEINPGQLSFESTPRHTSSGFVGGGFSGIKQTNVHAAQYSSYQRQTEFNSNVVTSGFRAPICTKPPRYPEYLEQQKRQESFARWPVDNKPDPFLLADCGFFFTGNQDLVRCHQCGVGLKDWLQEDDVITEHVKHSSSCVFIVRKFGKNRIERMKLALSYDDQNKTVSNAPHSLPYKIRSPRYQTMEARMASFKVFPKNIQVPAQQLAVAGLFYTGKGDLCRCFTCDGGLNDWSSGDDPIKEHATSEYVKQHNQQSNESLGAPDSSFAVNQVVQKLGISKVEVKTARAELEMKGNKCPTAEDIVNTVLDMQESSGHVLASSIPQAAAPEPERENEKYEKQLKKCTSKFVEQLSPGIILDLFFESDFLTFVETRDIRELQLTSDKNRAILQKVMMKRGYLKFIGCLRQSNQGHLVLLLEKRR